MKSLIPSIELRVFCPELTTDEIALLEWLATGRTNAQIGQCVARSEKTVRNQLTRVYAKLGVANRVQAVALYLRVRQRS